jgi:hypothetical protein
VQRGKKYVLDLLGFGVGRSDQPDELLHLSLRERVIRVSAGMLQWNQC